ncbi:MAG TPA: hypothetical protein VK666_07555 [Chryseolinea sp.]|nr:hypothetical protein [Chryseolinea sp.]
MTKALCCVAIALFIALVNCYGQDFEGKITYETAYKSNIPGMSDEQLSLMLGTSQQFFIKGGNYKTTTNGTFLLWQIFINKDSKLYNKMASSEALLWNDVSINTDEIVKAEINKNAITILGNPCDELVLTSKNAVEKYYFSSEFKIDAKLFINHKFNHWDEFTKRSNALPLKMIINNPQMILEAMATEVLPMKLDDKIFALPAGAKTERNPF